jgi:hypothetical protein
MDSQLLWLGRSAAGLLLLLALAGAGPVAAGMFATEGAVANFSFTGSKVVYSTPSISEVAVQLSPDNAVQLKVRQADGTRDVFDPESGFKAKLNLGAKMTGETVGSSNWLLFGSIPSAQDSKSSEIMNSTLDAMQRDGDEGALSFLVPDQPTTGTLAQQYRSLGVYAYPAGSDPVEWVSQSPKGFVGDPADTQTAAESRPAPTAAIPAPATALLILAGLLGLVYRQRRASTA